MEIIKISYFFIALKEGGHDENYGSSFAILLNFELPIVAE